MSWLAHTVGEEKLTAAEWIAEMRAVVAAGRVPGEAAPRDCPHCGEALELQRGRSTGKFFYTHKHVEDCARGMIGRRVMFASAAEADRAEVIFKTNAESSHCAGRKEEDAK